MSSQGVAFKTDTAKNKIILYVVTTEAVMSYDLNGDKLVWLLSCFMGNNLKSIGSVDDIRH